MTTDKHLKRAARELAAREGISYTAARRLLTDGAGETYTLEPTYAVLERHSVFCVGMAMQEAIDLGIDDDEGIRQVAAQRLEDEDTACRCLTEPAETASTVSYRVPVHFQEPPAKARRFIDVADFAWQLFDLLGIYSPVDIRWRSLQIDATGVERIDEHDYLVAVTVPVSRPASGESDSMLEAAGAVARALAELSYNQQTAAIDYERIRAIPGAKDR
jgi:hypothetical protein